MQFNHSTSLSIHKIRAWEQPHTCIIPILGPVLLGDIANVHKHLRVHIAEISHLLASPLEGLTLDEERDQGFGRLEPSGFAQFIHAAGPFLIAFVDTRKHDFAVGDALAHGLSEVEAHVLLVVPHGVASLDKKLEHMRQ